MQNFDRCTTEFEYLSRMLRAFVTFESEWRAATGGGTGSKVIECPELSEKALEMQEFAESLGLSAKEMDKLTTLAVGLVCEAEKQGIRVGFELGLSVKTSLDRLWMATLEQREEQEP